MGGGGGGGACVGENYSDLFTPDLFQPLSFQVKANYGRVHNLRSCHVSESRSSNSIVGYAVVYILRLVSLVTQSALMLKLQHHWP